jgi:hypothetical protein
MMAFESKLLWPVWVNLSLLLNRMEQQLLEIVLRYLMEQLQSFWLEDLLLLN